ncbi:HTH_Tnp_Tc3_2 domain-containing protein [Trichonephila clavipes]|nr:HTH_Tnp_Tc3_2 domain-containing protein [Trichonephila clavipes]
MSTRHHLSDYDRGQAVGQLEAGQSITTVAAAIGVSKSVISLLKKATEGGNALRKYVCVGGRGRNITPLEDRYVSPRGKKNRYFTPCQKAANLATTTGTHVSTRIASRQLNQVDLYTRKPVRCIPL